MPKAGVIATELLGGLNEIIHIKHLEKQVKCRIGRCFQGGDLPTQAGRAALRENKKLPRPLLETSQAFAAASGTNNQRQGCLGPGAALLRLS